MYAAFRVRSVSVALSCIGLRSSRMPFHLQLRLHTTPPSSHQSHQSAPSDSNSVTAVKPAAVAAPVLIQSIEESINGRRRQFEIDSRTGSLLPRWDSDDTGSSASAAAFLKSVFLPTGFPHTVMPYYSAHHAWIAGETLFTCIQYVLCHQSMLDALGVAGGGVGAETAAGAAVAVSAAAVAVQWVLKDGLGELGKLFVSRYYSRHFDSRPKTWKLIGEILQHIGSALMILTPFAPSYLFLPLAGLGNAFRAASYMAWGATTALFERHLARKPSYLAELMNKMDSQSVVANLAGMSLGVLLLAFSPSATTLAVCFAALVPISLHSTLRSLSVLQINYLNHVQLNTLIHLALLPRIQKPSLLPSAAVSGRFVNHIPTPLQYHRSQRWFGEWNFRVDAALDVWQQHEQPSMSWFQRLRSASQALHRPLPISISIGDSLTDAFVSAADLQSALSVQRSQAYLLWLRKPVNGETQSHLSIVLHADAQQHDIVTACVHAALVAHALEPNRLPINANYLAASSIAEPVVNIAAMPSNATIVQQLKSLHERYLTGPIPVRHWAGDQHPISQVQWPLSNAPMPGSDADWLHLVQSTAARAVGETDEVIAAMTTKGWSVDALAWPDQGIRATWDRAASKPEAEMKMKHEL